MRDPRLTVALALLPLAITRMPGAASPPSAPADPIAGLAVAPVGSDMDQDGLPDAIDSCPAAAYEPGFDWLDCDPMDLDPGNDVRPECKARERVLQFFATNGAFNTHIAFAVVVSGEIRLADAFTYLGQGVYTHDPGGIHRLYRIGSTSKSVTAVAAKALEAEGVLSLDDFVSDEDASQVVAGGERRLRHLLSHDGAFKTDYGAIHLFCYPGDLLAFWAEPNDLVSPHYDSPPYGNLGGGFEYSAFNFSLAGAYLAGQASETFAQVAQSRVFDTAGMCTAMLDGARAVTSPNGGDFGVSQMAVMHVGPYINLVSPTDDLCEDNFYSSDDVYGEDDYDWQLYFLDEASAEARDPAGGVIASAVDLAHFALALLDSYHGVGDLLSPEAVRELWGATQDLGCGQSCPYQPYYGLGFFTDSLPGQPVMQCEHGGSRPGYTSAFVLRPEANLGAAILVNADVSTVAFSSLGKAILDDFEAFACPADLDDDGEVGVGDFLIVLGSWGGPNGDANGDGTTDVMDFLAVVGSWGPCL